jgi:hypothetical protein
MTYKQESMELVYLTLGTTVGLTNKIVTDEEIYDESYYCVAMKLELFPGSLSRCGMQLFSFSSNAALSIQTNMSFKVAKFCTHTSWKGSESQYYFRSVIIDYITLYYLKFDELRKSNGFNQSNRVLLNDSIRIPLDCCTSREW